MSTGSTIPRRASGLYLTGDELYALACRSFDFWYQKVIAPEGTYYEVTHNGEQIAKAGTAASARAVIVERFKGLLKGGE